MRDMSIRAFKQTVRVAAERVVILGPEPRYSSPPGYESWDDHIARCKGTIAMAEGLMRAGHQTDPAFRSSAAARLLALESLAPARYLTAEVVQAFAHTPPPSLTPDLLDVLPGVHLMLPRGAFVTEDGYSLCSITVGVARMTLQADGSVFAGLVMGADCFLPKDGQVFDRERNATPAVQYSASLGADGSTSPTEICVPEDDNLEAVVETAEAITRIAVNALAATLHEPALLTTDPEPVAERAGAGVGFKSKPRRDCLPITWIGKGYRSTTAPASHGETRRVREFANQPHWRRGHWKQVACGRGWQDHRLTWIRPVLVNAHLLAGAES